jgi:iron(II)-dependent oxidoreductase
MRLNFFTRGGAGRRKAEPGNVATAQRFAPAPRVTLPSDPLEKALEMGRFGQIVFNANGWRRYANFEKVHQAAMRALDDCLGYVPEGFASLHTTIDNQPGAPEQDHEVRPFLLARHCVTNAEYQMFVDDGGYEDLDLWPEEIWPHLIGFKDQTGHAAPRYWCEGRHDRTLARHPVVGVCYYEAVAYARWAGVRLPTSAEWQMAATWRIRSSAHVQRRYPWGDALDLGCCNIWASGHRGTLPVDACPGGAAPNNVQQLIGNVWEWTDSDFLCTDEQGRVIVGEMLMKCIRGGAFDTYFPWQATSTFVSGLGVLSRARNVGVRCAADPGEGMDPDGE